mmetsp:Transcript_82494/g.163815  ORF Transcript_82494/g.163815 Transcript_82494/m.163815 type:complete len:97 (-) Transcript_82494:127-417(-)
MAPSEVILLYRGTLRAAKLFSNYNFRHYFVQRAREDFRSFDTRWRKADVDATGQAAFIQAAQQHLGMLQRQGSISVMYESARGQRSSTEVEKGRPA